MKLFAKIVNGWKPLANFAKKPIRLCNPCKPDVDIMSSQPLDIQCKSTDRFSLDGSTGLKWNKLEAYLEPSQISTMELFWKNSWRLKAVNYFRKNTSSQMFDWVLNTSLQTATCCRSFLETGVLKILENPLENYNRPHFYNKHIVSKLEKMEKLLPEKKNVVRREAF